jgi:hypothetical protein
VPIPNQWTWWRHFFVHMSTRSKRGSQADTAPAKESTKRGASKKAKTEAQPEKESESGPVGSAAFRRHSAILMFSGTQFDFLLGTWKGQGSATFPKVDGKVSCLLVH